MPIAKNFTEEYFSKLLTSILIIGVTRKMSKKKSGKKVLVGHKQIGKRFIPPMIHLISGMDEVSWVNEILPELIWFGVLNHRLGIRKGTDIGSRMSKFAMELYNKKEPNNFSYISSYNFLDEYQKDNLVKKLEKEKVLDSLRYGIGLFLRLYPDSPLNFIAG